MFFASVLRVRGAWRRLASLGSLSAIAFCSASAQTCQTSFTFTGAGDSAVQSNLNSGCTNWVVTYNSTGFSALSLTLQSADNAGGVPGSFVTFAGTVDTGVNPNTATTSAFSTFTGYYPFLRVDLAGLTGSGKVTGILYGWRSEPGGGGGSVPNPLPVDGCDAIGAAPTCNPVFSAGYDGSVIKPFLFCSSQAAVNLTASGNTQIIALAAAKRVRICHISISGDSAVNVKFTTGTGANCATGTADLTGFYQQTNALALDFSGFSPLTGGVASAVCVNLSGASNWGGVVMYAQF